MSEPTQYSAEDLAVYIVKEYEDQAPDVIAQINRWLARGDGVAVYVNQDLGHPDLGMPQIISYGSTNAQLETDALPEQLPDIGGRINWRYQLEAVYRGEPLEVEGK